MTSYIEAATAVATAVGGLIVALIVVLSRIHSQSQATLAQVSNDHGTNLRDDIDRIYDALTDIRQSVHETRAAIGALETRSHDTYSELSQRIRELEK